MDFVHIISLEQLRISKLGSLRSHHTMILWMRNLGSRRLSIEDVTVVGRARKRSEVS